MTTATSSLDPAALTLNLDKVVELTDDQLFELCQSNRDLRIERTAEGELILMPPAGGKTSDRNAAIVGQLWQWAAQNPTGRAFDSSGGFNLPNGAMRSPDAAWIELERLRPLSEKQREKFLPLCPTFVVELRSPSDTLASVQTKMEEYIENGALLGWLIDPMARKVHVYRPSADVEILEGVSSVSGDPVLPGFELQLAGIWNPAWV